MTEPQCAKASKEIQDVERTNCKILEIKTEQIAKLI